MGKHSRKRQRTDDAAPPLGAQFALADDASKDDEERRLESLLFGKPYVPRGEAKSAFDHEGDGSVGGLDVGGDGDQNGVREPEFHVEAFAAPGVAFIRCCSGIRGGCGGSGGG